MALPKTYGTNSTAGAGTTASVANGATAVTGEGTAWANTIKADDRFWAQGLSVRVASVESNTALTLAEGWPGTSLDEDTYEIGITYDGPEFQLKTREVIAMLNELQALGIQPNAFGVGSDRDEFDARAKGFIFLDLGSPWTLYAKETDADADWTPGQVIEGPQGDPGNIDSSNDTVTDIIKVSQAAYDALSPPDDTTLYIITED